MTNTYTIDTSNISSLNNITLNTTTIPTITLTGSGASGTYLTSSGTTYSTAWAQPNNNFVSNNGKAVMTIPADKQEVVLEKDATLNVKGNVVINGVDLEERLKTIETILNIPQRDVTMEAKYPKLAELYKQYMRELEKYKTWDRVKGENE